MTAPPGVVAVDEPALGASVRSDGAADVTILTVASHIASSRPALTTRSDRLLAAQGRLDTRVWVVGGAVLALGRSAPATGSTATTCTLWSLAAILHSAMSQQG